ncbi:MAG: ATP-binding cassette domain-containing protein [Eubacteriaceae bacterium]|nr:ATP-binding cassette domain-containing protein [Eubacteriaceae bacterium]
MRIEIINLRKNYGNLTALDDLSLTLDEGIYGILGANGAGKSTLLNLLTDNAKRSSGQILLDGEDILQMGARYRRLVGYMPQQQGLYEQMSAKAFLLYIAELKELKKKDAKAQIESLLVATNLSDVASKKIAGFSGGMRQRLLLAQALLGNPQLLYLDEPTAGLDPKERIRVRNYISSISKGKTILLATHIASDIELIANQVIILKRGRIAQMGDPDSLAARLRSKVKEYEFPATELDDNKSRYSGIAKKHKISNIIIGNGILTARLVGDKLPEGGKPAQGHITLEDAYLYFSGDE